MNAGSSWRQEFGWQSALRFERRIWTTVVTYTSYSESERLGKWRKRTKPNCLRSYLSLNWRWVTACCCSNFTFVIKHPLITSHTRKCASKRAKKWSVFLWFELYLQDVCWNLILVNSVTICKTAFCCPFLFHEVPNLPSAVSFCLFYRFTSWLVCFLFPLFQLLEVLFKRSLMPLNLSVTTFNINPWGFCSYTVYYRDSWIVVILLVFRKSFDVNPTWLLS
jgi:hypothetical protein